MFEDKTLEQLQALMRMIEKELASMRKDYEAIFELKK
jgi:hypothetical protein